MTSFTSQPYVEFSQYPSSVYTGWLPASTATDSWNAFFKDLKDNVVRRRRMRMTKALPEESPVIPLLDFLTGVAKDANGEPLPGTNSAKFFFDLACNQNKGLVQHFQEKYPHILPIPDAHTLTEYLDGLLDLPPSFYANMLVGLPFSAVFASIDPTMSGSRCLNLPGFNDTMRVILNKWQQYLDGPDSGEKCFGTDGKEWLSDEAKISYGFDLWKKDNEKVPFWNSWNSFFIREFKDSASERPIAAPDSNQVVCSPNDGQLFRWDMDIKKEDTFWLKDMNYSLQEIFSSSDPAQQQLMNDYKLAEMFTGGYMFQTFLNPNNYHHWWAPVNGKVLFDPIVIQGVFFNKLIKPDFEGATVASLPYLVHVNSRGIAVFKTPDFGHVCCIPIGMSEVSTVEFDKAIREGKSVTKGQEIGVFKYGGSSFAILFQKLPGKDLIFHSGAKYGLYPSRPTVPTEVSVVAGIIVNIGQQIGMWVDATD